MINCHPKLIPFGLYADGLYGWLASESLVGDFDYRNRENWMQLEFCLRLAPKIFSVPVPEVFLIRLLQAADIAAQAISASESEDNTYESMEFMSERIKDLLDEAIGTLDGIMTADEPVREVLSPPPPPTTGITLADQAALAFAAIVQAKVAKAAEVASRNR